MGLSLTAVGHAQDAADGEGTPAAAAGDSDDGTPAEDGAAGDDGAAADGGAGATPGDGASEGDGEEELSDYEKLSLVGQLRYDSDVLWTALAAFMVFFMQAGFALVESGFTRAKNACNIIMKNVMDLSLGSITFWLVGFGLMFGASASTKGFIGTTDFFFDAGDDMKGWVFILFQTMFAATAATIVSGAVAGRTKFVGYLAYSLAITVIVYPIFGAWSWGGLFNGGGWLEDFSFMGFTRGVDEEGNPIGMFFNDYAGSTVVHSVGGWCALAGAIVIGPRIGKFTKEGKPLPIPGHNIPLAALGVLILWLGWFGFNAGSTTEVAGGGFAKLAYVTTMAASAGAFASMIASWALFKKPDPSFTLNGALAGLVSITAGCADLSPLMSVIAGFIGGLIVVFAVIGLERCKIDDPVGAVSVHGVCGVWGTLAVGLLSPTEGLLLTGQIEQTVIQLIGIVAAFAWAFPVSLAIFLAIKYTIGLRADEKEELEGLDISEHGMYAYPPAMLTDPMAGNVPTGASGAAMVATKPSVETT